MQHAKKNIPTGFQSIQLFKTYNVENFLELKLKHANSQTNLCGYQTKSFQHQTSNNCWGFDLHHRMIFVAVPPCYSCNILVEIPVPQTVSHHRAAQLYMHWQHQILGHFYNIYSTALHCTSCN